MYLPDQGSLPEEVPLAIFGGVGLIGGVCAMLLPESIGTILNLNYPNDPNTLFGELMCANNSKFGSARN